MATREMWTCGACHQTRPAADYKTAPNVNGLLCPNCQVRYAYSRETAGKARCPQCGGWAPASEFYKTLVDLDRRGDGRCTCPLCNAAISGPVEDQSAPRK